MWLMTARKDKIERDISSQQLKDQWKKMWANWNEKELSGRVEIRK